MKRLLMQSIALLVLTIGLVGCQVEPESPRNAQATTYVFVCPDLNEYVLRLEAEKAWLFSKSETYFLKALSARHYRDGGNEQIMSDESATVRIRAGESQQCSNDVRRAIWEHAKLNGADYRAVGNEPGWEITIMSGNRIVIVSDYGAISEEFPAPEPVTDIPAQTTTWETEGLILQVTAQPCLDNMSGEAFESSVRVVYRNQELFGCGRALH